MRRISLERGPGTHRIWLLWRAITAIGKSPPIWGFAVYRPATNSWPTSRERAMSARVKRKVVPSRKCAEAITSDSDYWVWAVIFTTAALTALCVVTIFSVATG